MPTKFVQNSAEKAGISIEAAEKKWAEAKAAVHKGKRRGSWYWGKVMNTFKRMMGLMEEVTFKDWILLEEDGPFAHWPKMIRLYGPFVAVRGEHVYNYIRYDVERILGEKTNVQLAASLVRPSMHEPHTGATFTLGLDGDFAQRLGIQLNGDAGTDHNEFKKWAIDAMKSKADKLNLTEAKVISIPQGVSQMPEKIMLGAGGFYLEKFDVKPTNAVYRILRLLDDDVYGRIYIAKRKVGVDMQYMWQMHQQGGGPVATKRDSVDSQSFSAFNAADLKKWTVSNLGLIVPEAMMEEEVIAENAAIDHSLRAKAEKHGVKASILRAVFNRGLAAWRKSHRPGTSAPQWAHARVNSFLAGGPARKSDQDLWDKRH
jgi:hypothetical protein